MHFSLISIRKGVKLPIASVDSESDVVVKATSHKV